MSDTALLNLGAWWLQAGALALAAVALACVVRVDAPTVRYAWWRVVLIACLALPVLQPWQPAAVTPPDGPSVARPAAEAAVPMFEARPVPSVTPPASPARVGWTIIATAILVVGAVLRLAWIAAGLVRLRRVRRLGIEPRLSESVDDLVQALRDAGADVRLVPTLQQPVTFGVRSPIVLLPARLETMPPGVQRAVLAHELWHVRRRDWLWSLSEEAVGAVLWFHPAIWYLVSQIQSAREEVVDELSIRSLNARRSYLEALLAFADAPAAYPAAPFIRRRQLFHRMMLITREGVMSSKRIVASCAGMAGALALVGWYAGAAFPLTADTMPPRTLEGQPPRDPRPAARPSDPGRESELADTTATDPSNVKAWLELAKLQEQRGAVAEAERTLRSALTATAGSREAARGLATFFYRQGDVDNAMALLEDLAARHPTDASGHQLMAAYYEEKARKDHSLTPGDRRHYIDAGIRATDRALAQDHDYTAALTYKAILLRAKGALEANQTRRQTLMAQAQALHHRASELSRPRVPVAPPAGAPPPPPPPPPPPSQHYVIDGQRAVRVGGDIAAPAKIHHVDPIYPQAARNAGVGGSVDIEIAVDAEGVVRSTFFKRSRPALDQAALAAVKQWRFEPTVVDGAAVPVLMMVTVDVGPDR